MSTLLLRLAAPLQSWGTDSKFEVRRTGGEPSKSGVIGLLAAALGRRRDESLSDLCALKMGIRVDQPGVLLRDFHMCKGDKDYITNRYYLSDAIFVVGLESSDVNLLAKLDNALKNPVFPLFLGRRSCPPTLPLTLGIRSDSLIDALTVENWQTPVWRQRPKTNLRLICDSDTMSGNVRCLRDLPISFSPICRQFGYHLQKESGYVEKSPKQANGTAHDAMAELMIGG